MTDNIALDKIFQTVTKALSSNQSMLNDADSYNHDHGDHMVEIFQVITQAMQEKKGADPADQLAYASDLLRRKSQSGSAAMYAQNLEQASQRFQGKSLNTETGLLLVESLLGTKPQEQQTGAGALASLLGGLLGGGQSQVGNQAQAESKPQAGGLGMEDLLTAGMAFMSSKQQGDSDMEAIVDAVVAASSAGQTDHRAKSGSIVANTLLQSLMNK